MSNQVVTAARDWAHQQPETVLDYEDDPDHGFDRNAAHNAALLDLTKPNAVRTAVLALVEVPCPRNANARLMTWDCEVCGPSPTKARPMVAGTHNNVPFDLDAAAAAWPEAARDALRLAYYHTLGYEVAGVPVWWSGVPAAEAALLAAFEVRW